MSKKPAINGSQIFTEDIVETLDAATGEIVVKPRLTRTPYERAARRHESIKGEGVKQAVHFVRQGILLYFTKIDGKWRLINGKAAYTSFDQYLADPDNEITPSTGHLGVQVCHLFFHHLRFNFNEIAKIGQKKLGRLTPFLGSVLLNQLYVELEIRPGKWEERELVFLAHLPVAELEDEGLTEAPILWKRLRDLAWGWIVKAQTLSYTDLGVAIDEAKRKTDKETGVTYGWSYLLTPQNIQVKTLIDMQKQGKLLEYLGIVGIAPDEMVYLSAKRRVEIEHEEPEEGG